MSYFVFKRVNKTEDDFSLFSGPYDDYDDAIQSYSQQPLTADSQDTFIIHNLKPRKVRQIGEKNIIIHIREFDPRETKSMVLNYNDQLFVRFVINGTLEGWEDGNDEYTSIMNASLSIKAQIETTKDDCILISFNTADTGYQQIYLYNTELQNNPVVREFEITRNGEPDTKKCRVEFYTNFNSRKSWVEIFPCST